MVKFNYGRSIFLLLIAVGLLFSYWTAADPPDTWILVPFALLLGVILYDAVKQQRAR
jgi:amino acid permease